MPHIVLVVRENRGAIAMHSCFETKRLQHPFFPTGQEKNEVADEPAKARTFIGHGAKLARSSDPLSSAQ